VRRPAGPRGPGALRPGPGRPRRRRPRPLTPAGDLAARSGCCPGPVLTEAVPGP
jgi:hypothetical protein